MKLSIQDIIEGIHEGIYEDARRLISNAKSAEDLKKIEKFFLGKNGIIPIILRATHCSDEETDRLILRVENLLTPKP